MEHVSICVYRELFQVECLLAITISFTVLSDSRGDTQSHSSPKTLARYFNAVPFDQNLMLRLLPRDLGRKPFTGWTNEQFMINGHQIAIDLTTKVYD